MMQQCSMPLSVNSSLQEDDDPKHPSEHPSLTQHTFQTSRQRCAWKSVL